MRGTAIALVLFGVLAPACSLDRSAIVDHSAPRDGGSTDATVAPRDARPVDGDGGPIEPIDAGPPDAPPPTCAGGCTDGRECVGGACVCPAGSCCPGCSAPEVCNGGTGVCECPMDACCPACTGTDVCVGGTCRPITMGCGARGEPCCSGACDDMTNDVCASDGWSGGDVCQSCGADGEPCCTGDRCDGPTSASVCARGRCSPCGGWLQPCCTTGTDCRDGTHCGDGLCTYL